MTLAEFNALPAPQAEAALADCCGSAHWASGVAARRPYPDMEALYKAADSIWWNLGRADWLEAFSHHPQIGDKPASGSESARRWAEGEQSSARTATDDVKERLARANRAYFEKFGYIYIVCATGKTAEGMLAILNQRLQNDAPSELSIAAEQQRVITHIRIEKLLSGEKQSTFHMSAITTHVLDTSRGRPAAGVRVELHRKAGSEWKLVGEGQTDANGRCQNLAGDAMGGAGTYRLLFHAGAYYEALRTETLYSEIPVIFEVRDSGAHYHVPLLLNPFGYSTYRGS